MAVTATNLIAGPATLYVGVFGAVEPLDASINAAPAASAWTDLGATHDGITLNVNLEYLEMDVDQLVDIVGRRLTKRDLQIQANLAEPTLANLRYALNGGVIATGGNYQSYDPADDTSATQPTYWAYILDGIAPAGFRRRIVVRKALSVEGIESAYKKDEMTLTPTTLSAHWVSSSIKPFRFIDQTA